MAFLSVPTLVTVTGGLEDLAAMEVERILLQPGDKVVAVNEGHVRFSTPLAALSQLSELSISSHIWAVAMDSPGLLSGSEDATQEDLAKLDAFAAAVWGSDSWGGALAAWAHCSSDPSRARALIGALVSAGAPTHALPEQLRMHPSPSNDEPPSTPRFRMHCKRKSSATEGHKGKQHGFGSMDAAKAVGGALAAQWGWDVQLSSGPGLDLDFKLVVSGRDVRLLLHLLEGGGGPCRRPGLSLSRTALRPSIASAMAQLRRLRSSSATCSDDPGPNAELVVDPMCGGGSIGFQIVAGWPAAHVINGELADAEVQRCYANTRRCMSPSEQARLAGCRWDAKRIPLRSAVADSVVSDLPWGKNVGSGAEMEVLYPLVLREVARILVPGTGVAVVLTKNVKLMARVLGALWAREAFTPSDQEEGGAERDGLSLPRPRIVLVGGMRAGLYCLKRSCVDWEEAKAAT